MLKIFEALVLCGLVIISVFGCSPLQVKDQSEVMLEPSKAHEDCMELVPANVLNFGRNTISRIILIINEINVNTTDSDRNCATSGPRRDPATFLKPTSRARLVERAVARFM